MKRIMKITTVLIMCLTLLMTNSIILVNASETNSINYVALGDSITEAKPNGYVDLIGKGINATSIKNAGVSGWTSSDVLTQVKTATDVRSAIKSATIVTIDIGSNDILYKIGDHVTTILGCSNSFESLNAKITSMQKEYNKATGFYKMYLGMQMMYKASQIKNAIYSSTNISNSTKTYKNNLTNIIKEVKTLNPNAKIYIGNLYNPYKEATDVKIGSYKLFNAGEIVEKWEISYNKAINEVANTYKYPVIDIHSVITSSSQLLGDPINNNWDPHPNSKGHQDIATAFLIKIKN